MASDQVIAEAKAVVTDQVESLEVRSTDDRIDAGELRTRLAEAALETARSSAHGMELCDDFDTAHGDQLTSLRWRLTVSILASGAFGMSFDVDTIGELPDPPSGRHGPCFIQHVAQLVAAELSTSARDE